MTVYKILHLLIVGLTSFAAVPLIILVILNQNYQSVTPDYFGFFLIISAASTLILLFISIVLSLLRNDLGRLAWTSFFIVICIYFLVNLAIPAVT